MREMPVSKAPGLMGECDQRMWRILFAHVDDAYSKLDMSDVVWIGADEMSARKGHDYLTVFADLMEKRFIFATEGNDAETFQRFADALYAHNGHPKAITQVAIDMSPAYQKGVRENLGNAEIVFDKYHALWPWPMTQSIKCAKPKQIKETRISRSSLKQVVGYFVKTRPI